VPAYDVVFEVWNPRTSSLQRFFQTVDQPTADLAATAVALAITARVPPALFSIKHVALSPANYPGASSVFDEAEDPLAWFDRSLLTAGIRGQMPIEWIQEIYADDLGGATLATDARKVIQFAWNLTAGLGIKCTIGPGTYALDSSQASAAEWPNGPTPNGVNRGCLVVPSGLDFEAAAGARFLSNVSLGGARGMITTDRGNYRQAALTPPSNVTIRGGIWGKVGSAATTATGNIFGLEVDNLRLIETIADGWQTGRAYNLAGNGHRHVRIGMQNPAGTLQSGGCRFWYGDDFDCDGLWGECGDDSAQLVTAFDPGDFWYGSITNAWYRNARVKSDEARGISVGLPAQNGTTPVAAGMTNEIAHFGFVDCLFISGVGGYPVTLQNQNSSGAVRDGVIRRCVFDHTLSSATSGFELAGAWGGVEDILFDGCTFYGALRDLVVLEGRIRNTTFRDCRLYAPRDENSSFRPIRLQGATATRFEGGFAEMMATAPASPANALFDLGISAGNATYSGDTYQTVNDGVFIGKGFEARNIRNSTFAVRTTRTNGLRLDGMRIKRADAASAGLVRTLVVVGGSNNDIFLDDNDFTDVANIEETAIDDTNAIVRRGLGNLGIKAPVQTIENDNNDNAIVGRGVRRVELTTTTVTYAITLNAPVEADKGNVLTIVMVADGGFDVTMDLANVTNLGGAFTTATWGDVGDALVLVPMNGVWWLLANNGVVLS
jgi:hypothetical protein